MFLQNLSPKLFQIMLLSGQFRHCVGFVVHSVMHIQFKKHLTPTLYEWHVIAMKGYCFQKRFYETEKKSGTK